ncbi:MAG: hypothetical protein WCP69_15600 [Bacteroidota bacterium]
MNRKGVIKTAWYNIGVAGFESSIKVNIPIAIGIVVASQEIGVYSATAPSSLSLSIHAYKPSSQ